MKTVLFINVTVYRNFTTTTVLSDVINWFNMWKNSDRFVNLFMNNWMWILLKSNWNNKVFKKARIYSLDLRNCEVVNKTFDEL